MNDKEKEYTTPTLTDWLMIAPCGILISPIGWIAIVTIFDLNFNGGAVLAITQIAIIVMAFIFSNGGE